MQQEDTPFKGLDRPNLDSWTDPDYEINDQKVNSPESVEKAKKVLDALEDAMKTPEGMKMLRRRLDDAVSHMMGNPFFMQLARNDTAPTQVTMGRLALSQIIGTEVALLEMRDYFASSDQISESDIEKEAIRLAANKPVVRPRPH